MRYRNGPAVLSRKSFALLPFVVSAMLFIGSGVFTAWAYMREETPPAAVSQTPTPAPQRPSPERDWQPFVEAGEQFAVSLASVDHRTIDADVRRILDASTGEFQRDFSDRAPGFKDATRSAQAVSTGTVTGAGLERLGSDHADVLVAVSVETANGDDPPDAPRSWRMRIGITHGVNGYRADKVEFVS